MAISADPSAVEHVRTPSAQDLNARLSALIKAHSLPAPSKRPSPGGLSR